MNPFKGAGERKERRTSKFFVAPTKEEATTGRFMPAGDSHGVGFRQPVGKKETSDLTKGPIKYGCKAFSPEEIV